MRRVSHSRSGQAAQASQQRFAGALEKAGFGPITSEIEPAPTFYYAETYHQQYLAKNPNGYCHLPSSLFEYARKAKMKKE